MQFCFKIKIAAFNQASGKSLNFLNHREVLKDGSLKFLINIVNKNQKIKTMIFFTNGAFGLKDKSLQETNFDHFVCDLGYFSSWSTGLGFWKKNFDKF